MAEISLNNIDAFIINDAEGTKYYGGNQKWFVGKDYAKEAACGATTCANILGYLSKRDEEYKGVCKFDTTSKDDFTEFMKAIYPFVKPGLIGIMPADFIKGAKDYARTCGIEISRELMTVPAAKGKRPSYDYMVRWISAAIEDDLPVAFLNLSSGRIKNLDGYHWVTVVAIDIDEKRIKIVDNGNLLDVDISKWLKRSTMGGAFVILEAYEG